MIPIMEGLSNSGPLVRGRTNYRTYASQYDLFDVDTALLRRALAAAQGVRVIYAWGMESGHVYLNNDNPGGAAPWLVYAPLYAAFELEARIARCRSDHSNPKWERLLRCMEELAASLEMWR